MCAYTADVVAVAGGVEGDVHRPRLDDVAYGTVAAAVVVGGLGHLDDVVLTSHKFEH